MKKNNKVIYVGKAKNLKRRVSSYFNREHEDEKTKKLVKNIEDIEIIICNSEVDAFVLENNLIKKYSPKYNILLKDEKTYPYIRFTKEVFPKIDIIRTTKVLDTKNGEYFGPYPQGAWFLLKTLIKIFKIRDCNKNMGKVLEKPCLKYHMGFCLAPCKFKNIKEEYDENIEKAKKILKGQGKEILKELEDKMLEASNRMEFEKAIVFREQKQEIERTIKKQIIEYGKSLDEDIFTFIEDANIIFICVLNMREGKILGKSSLNFSIKNKIYSNLFENIVSEFYSKHPIPNNIIFQSEYIESREIIESWLKIKARKKIKVYFPKILSRRIEILNMALLNLNRDIISYYNRKSVLEDGMKKLYDVMNLKRYPRVIECFDISNIQGKDAVASMSVAIEGKKSPKFYRKFKIKTKDTPDDFAMMREVIERRYKKLEIKDFPDVILIDGGLGQINAVGKVLEDIGKGGIAELLSIAKKEELIYKYGNNIPYVFSDSEEGLKILIRVRDEAHRFAITYHRNLRNKRVISSELDKIFGIGEIRKSKLLKFFGSVKNIKKAKLKDLKSVLPEKIAINLFKTLNEGEE